MVKEHDLFSCRKWSSDKIPKLGWGGICGQGQSSPMCPPNLVAREVGIGAS